VLCCVVLCCVVLCCVFQVTEFIINSNLLELFSYVQRKTVSNWL
jgi:hypothetical protein